MASKARWIDGFVRRRNVWFALVRKPGGHDEVALVSLPRQDLRRAAACANRSGSASLTNSALSLSILDSLNATTSDTLGIGADGSTVWIHRDRVTGRLVAVLDEDRNDVDVDVDDIPAPAPAPTPVPVRRDGGSLEAIVEGIATDAVRKWLETNGPDFDISDIREELVQIVKDIVPQPRQIVVKDREPVTIDGLVHERFDALVRKVSARRNLILTGEAGVGKTFLAEQIAEALGLECTTVSTDVLPQRAEILGGLSPLDRKVIEGKVRERYEHGGVFILDELDRGHPSLGTVLNNLLSGSSFCFDKDGGGTVRIQKHPDFVVLATANTYGNGASHRYVGAQKLDGAGLDRFTFFHVGCDETLTARILQQTDATSALQVLPIWTQARRNVERYGLDVFVSPRCAIDTQAFILAGDSVKEAFDGRLFGRGLTADQEAKLLEGIQF